MQKLIIHAKPDFESLNIPRQKWRRLIHVVISSNAFEIFIMVCIIVNMLTMAFYFKGAS